MAKITKTRAPSAAAKNSRQPAADDFDLDLEGGSSEPKLPDAKAPAQGTAQSYKRNMTGTKRVFTDLFKLMVAKVIKYEGWEEPGVEHPDSHPNKFSIWEHTHPFRTYDKKGQRVTYSTPIGGHFHVIEWEDAKDPEAPPVIKSVSGPMVMGKKVVKGRPMQVPVPANDFDDHTHDVEYIRSSEVTFSTTNVEAAKVVAWEAQKLAPIPGVGEAGPRSV